MQYYEAENLSVRIFHILITDYFRKQLCFCSANCARCAELHSNRQSSFPLKPQYIPRPLVVLDQNALQRQGVKKFTSSVLMELNKVYELEVGSSFTDAVAETKSSGLEKKRSKSEKIEEVKEVMVAVNEQFAENAAISMLAENESKRKYHRKRMAQSFCSPEAPPPAKRKKHSPSFANVTWDKDKLKETISSWPQGTRINWSNVARDHGIPGKNAGQVAKEFVEREQMDLSHIATPKRKQTIRPRRRKLPGTSVSIPSNPPINTVSENISSMVATGRFSLGVECATYTLTKYKFVDGTMTSYEQEVQWRKISLREIRQGLLEKHLKYMRLTPNGTIR